MKKYAPLRVFATSILALITLTGCVEIDANKEENDQLYLTCILLSQDLARSTHAACVETNSGDPNGFCGDLNSQVALSAITTCPPPP